MAPLRTASIRSVRAYRLPVLAVLVLALGVCGRASAAGSLSAAPPVSLPAGVARAPAASQVSAEPGAAAGRSGLPRTGTDVALEVTLGVGLVLTGAGLWLTDFGGEPGARRRRVSRNA